MKIVKQQYTGITSRRHYLNFLQTSNQCRPNENQVHLYFKYLPQCINSGVKSEMQEQNSNIYHNEFIQVLQVKYKKILQIFITVH